jgi:hypothetical protein
MRRERKSFSLAAAIFILQSFAPIFGQGLYGVAQTTVNIGTGGLGTSGAPLNTQPANPSTIYSNQQTATTTAAALPSQALTNGVVLTAGSSNTGTIYIGPSGVTTSTGYPLAAGQSVSYAVSNLNAIYMIGANTTDVLAFTGN